MNALPPELLAYIFKVGMQMGAEEDEDNEKEKGPWLAMVWREILPFQVLVSHVCRHWRQLALSSPSLWTMIVFNERISLKSFDRFQTWIERAKCLPLDIFIDCQKFDDLDIDSIWLSTFLDMIVPHVSRWRRLSFTCCGCFGADLLFRHLFQCPPAPLLEVFHLHRACAREDVPWFFEDPSFWGLGMTLSNSIFSCHAPRLKEVILWGFQLDWSNSISLLSGLTHLQLAYHQKDCRPSWAVFAKIISSCPEIQTLTLCASGPMDENIEHDDHRCGPDQLEIPSLKNLRLSFHEPKYATSLARKLSVPNLCSLSLGYSDENYTQFAQVLMKPKPGQERSLLAGLTFLKISSLFVSARAVEGVLEQLVNLEVLDLNCWNKARRKYFKHLSTCGGPSNPYCPNLDTLVTRGINGTSMMRLIRRREAAGAPIRKVAMSNKDFIDGPEEEWIRANVEELDFFKPSDWEHDGLEDSTYGSEYLEDDFTF